jgi:hypothetical protein
MRQHADKATGGTLLVPPRERRSKVDRITVHTRKVVEEESVTDGFLVAAKRGGSR